jgi:large subunit ribosomal protein L18e
MWARIANDLEMPTRKRRVVNLSRLNRFTKADETVIVPGKVLGSGILAHNLTIAAFAFSDGARERITQAKGKCLTIPELLKQNPKGKDIRIMG